MGNGSGLLERLLGLVVILGLVGVLMQELTRLVRDYAGWILLGALVVVGVSLLIRTYYF